MTPKKYDHLLGQIPGLSDKQLKAHFELYQGYVKKLTELEDKLAKADRSSPNYSYNEYSELMRRRAIPHNGAYLHEMYFDALSGTSSKPSGELLAQIETDFGSHANWWKDTQAGLTSAHGWVLLVRSRHDGRLRNDLVEEHHRGVLCEQDIVLALDGWEHAYMIDYGTAKRDYLAVLGKAIDWQVAGERFRRSLSNSAQHGSQPGAGMQPGLRPGAQKGGARERKTA